MYYSLGNYHFDMSNVSMIVVEKNEDENNGNIIISIEVYFSGIYNPQITLTLPGSDLSDAVVSRLLKAFKASCENGYSEDIE